MGGTLDGERYIKKTNKQEIAEIKKEFKLQALIMAGFNAIFWGIYLVNNVITSGWLGRHLVLEPRTLEGFFGMLFTPFFHVSFWHTVGSSIALLILGWWVMLRDTRDFFLVHLLALLGSGTMLWAFDTSVLTTHWYGWGGISMGMAGYLLTAGIFERRWAQILSSGLFAFLFGSSVLTSLIPGATNTWFGVAGGFFGGVLAASYLGWRRRHEKDPENYIASERPSAVDLTGINNGTDVKLDFGNEDTHSGMSFSKKEEKSYRKS